MSSNISLASLLNVIIKAQKVIAKLEIESIAEQEVCNFATIQFF